MKLTFFHAGDGDCFLVSDTSEDGSEHCVLVDGGRKGTFKKHAMKAIHDRLPLDAVCVSHIDDDHISGVLALLEAEVERRVAVFNGDETKIPELTVGEFWYNGLQDLVGQDLAPDVASALSATAVLFAGSPEERLRGIAAGAENLATGERSGLELSRRIGSRHLNIARRGASGTPMTRDTDAEVTVGGMTFVTLGPSEDDIVRLRSTWESWVRSNGTALAKLHKEMAEDRSQMGLFQGITLTHPMIAAALGEGTSSITPPNLASLMFLVESDSTTALLTGDGSTGEILEGLAATNRLDAAGKAHVNLLKVQHHGASANVTPDFVRRVTADHYVFCGNGAHHNPELEVIEALARARLTGFDFDDDTEDAEPDFEGTVRGPGTPFKFWFTSSPTSPGLSDAREDHMEEVKKVASDIQSNHDPGARFSFQFLGSGSVEIDAGTLP